MHCKTWIWLGCALIAGGGTALAAPKPESAAKALVRGAKQLAQLKSYRIEFSVSGGLAKGADHALVETRVNESWTGAVRGKVVQLNQGEGFRLRRGEFEGAIQDGLQWKALLATDKGRLLGRLFKDPEATLARALRSKRRATWLAPVAGASADGAPAQAETEDGTRSGSRGASSELDEGPLPTVLEVEGPAIEAIQHFEQIVSSGCFAEG
ncbi:MAG: hypothetical protein KDD82_24500 [Planctomycetes bacterium]|nr:hypothetical protein [Planctomycetota bacterium]